MTGQPEVEAGERGGATMIWSGETEGVLREHNHAEGLAGGRIEALKISA
jgi:hypothetical protein